MSGHLMDEDSPGPAPAAVLSPKLRGLDEVLQSTWPVRGSPNSDPPPPPGSPYTPPVRKTRPVSPTPGSPKAVTAPAARGGTFSTLLPRSRSPSPPRLLTEERAATRASRREALGLDVAPAPAPNWHPPSRPGSPSRLTTLSTQRSLNTTAGLSFSSHSDARAQAAEASAEHSHARRATLAERTGVDAATLARRLSLAESAAAAAHVTAQLAADEAARATALLHAERARNEGAEAAAAAAERGRCAAVQAATQLEGALRELQHTHSAIQARLKQVTAALAASEAHGSAVEQELGRQRSEASAAVAAAAAMRRSGDATEAAQQRDISMLRAQLASMEAALRERDAELEVMRSTHPSELRARDDALVETGAALSRAEAALSRAEAALAAATQRGEQLSQQLRAGQEDFEAHMRTSAEAAARTAAAHASEVALLRHSSDAASARASAAEEAAKALGEESSGRARTLEELTRALKTEQATAAALLDDLAAERVARSAAQSAASEHAATAQKLLREVKTLRAERGALVAQHDAWIAAAASVPLLPAAPQHSLAGMPPASAHPRPFGSPPPHGAYPLVGGGAMMQVARLRADLAAEVAAFRAHMRAQSSDGQRAAMRSRSSRRVDSDDDDDDGKYGSPVRRVSDDSD